jgi:hypothetical protein
VSKALGQPFMPWQHLVADIAGEVDPHTGQPIYREVVLLVPRQSGKTTMLLASMIYRAWGMFGTFGRPQRTLYAAQTGEDALKKWLEHIEIVDRTPFRQLYNLDKVNGRQSLNWHNGSSWAPTATTVKSGHGVTLDQGVIDEAFAQIDSRTEQSMRPAMITRRDAQLFVVSTAGDATSIFLNAKIEENRERLQNDPDAPSRIAYFEWSADPDEDPADEATWYKCMPALGRTIHVDDIRAEYEGMAVTNPRGFSRAYLNITDTGASAETTFDQDDWRDTAVETYIDGPRAFALDIDLDRAWSSIAWCGQDPDGYDLAEVIAHERGTHWVIGWLRDKFDRYPKYERKVYVVGNSPAAVMEDDLREAGIDVVILSRADYAGACAKYYDGIIQHTMRHLPYGQVPLDVAQAGVVWSAGDARVWSRAKSTTIICPLVACTVASWGAALMQLNAYDVRDSVA